MDLVTINGIKVYPFKSHDEVVDYVQRHPAILIAINAGKLDRSPPELKQIINDNIGYCDGVAAKLALKKHGLKRPVIAGCDLWLHIVSRLHAERTFYLVGSSQDVIDIVVDKLRQEFPRIKIIAHRNGYIANDSEYATVIEDIREKAPDVVFVAMGSPKQERVMADMQRAHPGAIYQGLGGSFDVYSGRVERAPIWIRKIHAEGVYRFLTRIRDKNIRKRFFQDLGFYIRLKMGLVK